MNQQSHYQWFIDALVKFKPSHSQVIVETKKLKRVSFKNLKRVLYFKDTYPPEGGCMYPDRVQMVVKLSSHCYAYVDAKLCGVSGLSCRDDEDVKVYTAWSLLNLLQYAMDETTCETVKQHIGMKTISPARAQ